MQNIEGPYVDGVSLTHGEPGTRVHIWTFAADYRSGCGNAPSFLEYDYFCDGNGWNGQYELYAGNPLCDGAWFCKQLPQTTTDDIEIRICGNEGTANEDTPVEIIELYIR